MPNGYGRLVLRSGQRVPLAYQFSSTDGTSRNGYLVTDTAKIDPSAYCERLKLECADGTWIDLAVTHYSDRYIAFVGSVANA